MPRRSEDRYPVQDSTLSPEALGNDLPRLYDLRKPVECWFHRKGICDTYQVRTPHGHSFLKVYRHGRRTRTDVEEEVRLLLHLAKNGVSVARPIARTDQAFVTKLNAPEGDRYSVLFEAAPGECDDGGDLNKICSLGRTVGKMHHILDSFPLPYRRQRLDLSHLIDESIGAIERIMTHRQSDMATIRSIATRIKSLSLFGTMSSPEFGPCHGDLHGGDVAYDHNGMPTLFDFDSSGCGWRAYEIGVFPSSVDWMDTSRSADKERERRLASFLEGYSETRELSPSEREVVRWSPAIRHIFLMGHVLTYSTSTKGNHWVNDEFIDWHMTWFRHWLRRVDPG